LASGMVHGQTRSRISSGQLANLPIYLPPMDLQQQFAAFVEQTDKSKYHGESTCEMEVAA
ncbi:MAG: restriction endonuclease subunit S, partial [Fibrobacteraceae bacterium]|nr:restriction endonuclease subunit S [Fibrobacteraceae bacterium]